MANQRLAHLKARREELNMNGDAGEVDSTDLKDEAVRYVGLTQADSPSRMGIWVPCTLGQYKGLSVLYRTNNRTKVRLSAPENRYPAEVREADRAAKAANDAYQADQSNEALAEAAIEATREAIRVTNAYNDAFNKRQCEWLSNFVIGFEPWPFKDIAEPDPDVPESYHVLFEELEDLYRWLYGPGYEAALEAAAKNS